MNVHSMPLDSVPSAGIVVSNAPRDLNMFPNAISEVLYGRYRWWKRRACLAENADQWGKRRESWRYRVLAARLDNARELKRQQDAAKEKKENSTREAMAAVERAAAREERAKVVEKLREEKRVEKEEKAVARVVADRCRAEEEMANVKIMMHIWPATGGI